MKPRRIPGCSVAALLFLAVSAFAATGNRVVLPDAVTPEHYRIDKLNAFAYSRVPENARQHYVLAIARIRYQAQVRATRLPEVDRYLASQ